MVLNCRGLRCLAASLLNISQMWSGMAPASAILLDFLALPLCLFCSSLSFSSSPSDELEGQGCFVPFVPTCFYFSVLAKRLSFLSFSSSPVAAAGLFIFLCTGFFFSSFSFTFFCFVFVFFAFDFALGALSSGSSSCSSLLSPAFASSFSDSALKMSLSQGPWLHLKSFPLLLVVKQQVPRPRSCHCWQKQASSLATCKKRIG